MSDFVIKASRQGYDVKDAADHQLLFSSSFPLLKLVKSGTYNAVAGTGVVAMCQHDLGYYPFFMTYTNAGDYAGGYTASTSMNASEYPYVYCTDECLYVDTTFITTHDIRFEVYALDLETAVDYGSSKLVAGGFGEGDDYVMKVSKNGADIGSTDPRDFVIDTTKRSLIVHKVATTRQNVGDTPPADGISWYTNSHGLGYPPMFFAFGKDDTGPGYYNFQFLSANFAIADDTKITLGANLSLYGATSYTDVSMVMFKDAINSIM